MARPNRGARRSLPSPSSSSRRPEPPAEGSDVDQSIAAAPPSTASGTMAGQDPSSSSSAPSPASASRAALPSSHSYPFLAAPPPDRVFTRQLKRRSSTPSAPSSSSASTAVGGGPLGEERGRRSESKRRASRSMSKAEDISGAAPAPGSDNATAEPSSSAALHSPPPPPRRRRTLSPSASSSASSTPKRRRSSRHQSVVVHSPPTAPTAPSESAVRTTDSSRASEMDWSRRRYELEIVQEPTSGSAFGQNLLSRLPCAPPLILRLVIYDTQDNRQLSGDDAAGEPWLLCQVGLVTESGRPADMISSIAPPSSNEAEGAADAMASTVVEGSQKRRRGSEEDAGDASGEPSTRSKPTTPVRRSSRHSARATVGAAASAAPAPAPPPATASSSSPSSSPTTAQPPLSATQPRTAPSPGTSSSNASAGVGGGLNTSPTSNLLPHPLRMLYGSLAASPQVFRGMDGQMATFFFFPEVCVRVRGRYRLRATLMRLPSTAGPTAAPPAGPRVPQVGAAEIDTATDASTSGTRTTNTGAASASISTNAVLATVQTSPFTVHLASDYTAPYVTDVTRFFARQGAALPLPSGERID